LIAVQKGKFSMHKLWISVAYIAASVGLSAQPYGYVTNYGNGTVSVVNAPTSAIAGSPINVGPNPSFVAITPDGRHAYITNTNAAASPGSVSVIDTATNTVVATITVGDQPQGVAISPDGSKAWVIDFGFQNGPGISIIDTATNTVTTTITAGLGAPFAAAFSPDGSRAYVTDLGLGKVLVFDTATNAIVASPSVVFATALAVTPDGSHLYVTSEITSGFSVIDTSTNSVVAGPITTGPTADGVVITPDGSKAFVVNDGNATVSVVDTATNTVTATIGVGSCPANAAFSPDGSKLFVTNFCSGSVSVIDPTTNLVVATITSLSEPLGVGFQPPSLQQQTPTEMVSALITELSAPTLGLSSGEISSLTDKLNNVLASIQAGLYKQAINQLSAFINSVQSSAKTGKISATTAATLTSAANQIIAAL
jgi:YVTN family beta-propeller protein